MTRLTAVAALAAVALCSSCRRDGPPARGKVHEAPTRAQAPATALLVQPQHLRYTPRIVATETLRPRRQAQLAFVVSGTLERIAVKRGQAVAENTPLLLLDAAEARAALAQASGALAAARAQLLLASDALARIEAIREADGGVSESQLVQARGQRDLARARMLSSEAQRDAARVHLDRHVLRAPFAGVVTQVPDGVGVAVAPGVTLTALESTRELVLETSLTQEEAAEVPPGALVDVSVAATGAHTDDGVVTVVVPTVDQATSRVPVEIAVPNTDGRFLAHAFARASLPAGAPRDALKLPAAALVQREGAFSCWIADATGRARTVPVRVLEQEADWAIVEPGGSGFPPGARVVAQPPLGIAEGTLLAEASR
jgi:RND family efflux transporter MFP subunit